MRKLPAYLLLAICYLLLVSPVSAQSINLLEYFFPPAEPTNNISSGEIFRTVADGADGFIIYKSEDPAFYEKFRFNENFIYHLEDTTWATSRGNVKCSGTNDDAYFIPFDGKFGSNQNACPFYDPSRLPMKWVLRSMSINECSPFFDGTIVGFNKKTGECCDTTYTGPDGHKACLKYQGCIKFPTGVVSRDAIWLNIAEGAGVGENFYYDHNRGWIGFNRGKPCTGAYITDPIDALQPEEDCLEVTIQTPEDCIEMLKLENSDICADFDIYYHYSHQSEPTTTTVCANEGGTCMASGICTVENGTIDGTKGCVFPIICCKGAGDVLGAEQGPLEGSLELTREDIPDFSKAEERLDFAIYNFLPYELTQQVSIPDEPLKTRIKHFVGDSKAPETETTLPFWWTKILGLSSLFSGFYNTSEAPISVAIEIEQPDLDTISNGLNRNTYCQQTEKINAQPVSKLETKQAGFSVTAWITRIVDTIRKVIEDIISIFTKTTEDATLTNKTRGLLIGGKTFSEKYSEFWNSAVPNELQVHGSPLAADAQFEVSSDHGNYTLGEGSEKLNYHELNQAKIRYCLHLCSLYPAEFNIQEIDPLCHSCNPDDYKGPEIEFPECPTPPEECSWYRVNELGEIIPSCIICGNILFCYGNDYRLCPSDPIFPDPTPEEERDTTPAWNTKDPIHVPSGTILYNGMNFRVPEGGVYGCDSNVFGCSNDSCDYYQECADI